MFLWLALFLLVILISFILAFRSMKDYQEIPQKTHVEYGLFLVRQIKNFDVGIVDSIYQIVFTSGEIVSFERLFKGHQTALTIFGPKNILAQFQDELDLLELEDYTTEFNIDNVSIWEVGVRRNANLNPGHFNKIFSELPKLEADEQFFWQVIPRQYQVQIRAAVSSKDPSRKKMLTSTLQNLNAGGLIKIPKPFSTQYMIDFYRARSLSKGNSRVTLDSEGVLHLLRV